MNLSWQDRHQEQWSQERSKLLSFFLNGLTAYSPQPRLPWPPASVLLICLFNAYHVTNSLPFTFSVGTRLCSYCPKRRHGLPAWVSLSISRRSEIGTRLATRFERKSLPRRRGCSNKGTIWAAGFVSAFLFLARSHLSSSSWLTGNTLKSHFFPNRYYLVKVFLLPNPLGFL